MYNKLSNIIAKSVVLVLGITMSPSAASAFESGCKHGTEECVAGPQAARGDWHQSSEHQLIWQYASELAGLPDILSEPFNMTTYTNGSSVNVAGTSLPSLMPAPFGEATDTQSRSIHLADFSQLPDLSYSLWDWASGNETCPLDSDIDTQNCHDFSVHNGVVNSNHFLPQAFEAYKHYHALAMEVASQCAQVSSVSPDAADHVRSEYLLPCEKMALVYESVGHHFLQDAWSMGHMWERWGSPNRDVMHDHFNGLAVGATAGLIHGARSTMQAQLGWLGEFNDALCAPVHEEVQFKHSHGDETHPATGDNYFDVVISADQSANLSTDGEFIQQKKHMLSCAAQGILEVYRASGQNHGSANPNANLLDLSPTSEDDCFGQRATNIAMQKGAGIDVVWGGWWPYHVAIDGYTATTAILVVAGYNSDNYSDMSWWELWNRQSQYRNDLARVVSKMELYAKMDPEGTQLASGALGPMMDIQPNGYYLDEGQGVATYSDMNLSEHASSAQNTTVASTAMTRLFQDAYGPLWCDRFSGEAGHTALTGLKDSVAQSTNSQTKAAACGVCTNVVKRHIRQGTGPKSYDQTQEPVCTYAHLANLTEQPAAIVYHDGNANSPAELAADWCGCPTL